MQFFSGLVSRVKSRGSVNDARGGTDRVAVPPAEEGEGEGDGDGAKEDEEEDVPNIQLAWEVLELAKVIFTRYGPYRSKLLFIMFSIE